MFLASEKRYFQNHSQRPPDPQLDLVNLSAYAPDFSFFFLQEKSKRGCIRVRKLGDVKADTHSQQWERRLQENGLAWGAESYVTS